MSRLSIGDLVVGDIVLVEGFVLRQRLDNTRRSGEWDCWTTEFRMRSVSRLFTRVRPIEHVWMVDRNAGPAAKRSVAT